MDPSLLSDAPWPAELELEGDEPPRNDYELSRLWRALNRQLASVDRLQAYLAQVADCVASDIARRQERIDWLREQARRYLLETRQEKVRLSDLGTVFLTSRQQVTIDADEALAWAEREAPALVTREPRLDREALRRHVLATGEVVPGVSVEEVGGITFRAR